MGVVVRLQARLLLSFRLAGLVGHIIRWSVHGGGKGAVSTGGYTGYTWCWLAPIGCTDDDVLSHILFVLGKTVPRKRYNPYPDFFQYWPIENIGDIFDINIEDIEGMIVSQGIIEGMIVSDVFCGAMIFDCVVC
jgi:hypothetical protein